jgi:hypothetical protein
MSLFTVGIDPGVTGAAVLLAPSRVVDMLDWSDGPTVSVTLRNWQDLYAPALWALERVHSMPKQGVKSTWTFASNYGWWKGALDALCAPWCHVSPQVWGKGLPKKKTPTDKPSGPVARRLYPDAELATPRGRIFTGRTDAVLIARWALREVQLK